MTLKCFCGKEASYIWFDHCPDRLIPLCDRCLHQLFETFGEVNLNIYEIDDKLALASLINDINKQFEWHDKIRGILIKELFGNKNENGNNP